MRRASILQSSEFVLKSQPPLSGGEQAGAPLRLMLGLNQFLFGHLTTFGARKHLVLTPQMRRPGREGPTTDRGAVSSVGADRGRLDANQARA